MTNDQYYNVENHKIWFTGKNTSFRTSGYGKDTFNAAMTCYSMPMKLTRIPRFYQKNNKIVSHIAGVGPDPGYMGKHGKKPILISLEGEMRDLSLAFFLMKHMTTTEDTPSGYNTHTTNTTETRATTVPDFNLVYKMVNDEPANANDLWILYSGCILKHVNIKTVQEGVVTLRIDIECARAVVGTTALTSEPAESSKRIFEFDDGVVTFTKGGTAVPGKIIGWEIDYDDGTYLHKAAGEEYAEEALNGSRKYKLILDWLPKYEPDDIVINDDPGDTDDLDCTIKLSRNTTNDYEQFVFEKLWNADEEDGGFDYNNYIFLQKLNLVVKHPNYETGAKMTYTSINDYNNDRYET